MKAIYQLVAAIALALFAYLSPAFLPKDNLELLWIVASILQVVATILLFYSIWREKISLSLLYILAYVGYVLYLIKIIEPLGEAGLAFLFNLYVAAGVVVAAFIVLFASKAASVYQTKLVLDRSPAVSSATIEPKYHISSMIWGALTSLVIGIAVVIAGSFMFDLSYYGSILIFVIYVAVALAYGVLMVLKQKQQTSYFIRGFIIGTLLLLFRFFIF